MPSPSIRLRVLLILLAISGLASCSKQSDPAPAAQTFFNLLREGHSTEAYRSAAFSFQAQQTPEIFDATVKALGINNLTTVRWTDKTIGEKEAQLNGEMADAARRRPIKVKLIREGGDWKVYSFRAAEDTQTRPQNPFSLVGKTSGLESIAPPPIPPETEIKRMVLQTLLKFDAAVQKQDFSDFYAGVSNAWQKQLTEQRLRNAFEPFVTARVRIAGIQGAEMVLDSPPAVAPNGLLVIQGYFTTQPYRTTFGLKYIYELPSWKLFGIDVNLVAAKTPVNAAP